MEVQEGLQDSLQKHSRYKLWTAIYKMLVQRIEIIGSFVYINPLQNNLSLSQSCWYTILAVGCWRCCWTSSGIPKISLWHCAQGWWRLYCWWSSEWFWSYWQSLLGIPDTGCHSWHSHHGQGLSRTLKCKHVLIINQPWGKYLVFYFFGGNIFPCWCDSFFFHVFRELAMAYHWGQL